MKILKITESAQRWTKEGVCASESPNWDKLIGPIICKWKSNGISSAIKSGPFSSACSLMGEIKHGLRANYLKWQGYRRSSRLPEWYEDLSQLDNVYCIAGQTWANIYKHRQVQQQQWMRTGSSNMYKTGKFCALQNILSNIASSWIWEKIKWIIFFFSEMSTPLRKSSSQVMDIAAGVCVCVYGMFIFKVQLMLTLTLLIYKSPKHPIVSIEINDFLYKLNRWKSIGN